MRRLDVRLSGRRRIAGRAGDGLRGSPPGPILVIEMNVWQTTALGALAGFTIFLGLPVARLGPRTRTIQNLLNALAIGVLLFLVWDILSKAQEPIEEALKAAAKSGYWNVFASLVLMLA